VKTALLIAFACLLAAAVSLLIFNQGLTYDPAAWAVWAAELPHRRMGLGSGPSWKPLPVFVTAPFALVSWNFGGTAWLLIVRACAVGTSVLLWRMASRIASPSGKPFSPDPAAIAAGATAALLPWLIPSLVQFAAAGGSEPVLMALLLGAVEAHLVGRRRLALALGVLAGLVRPEVWAFLVLYGIWLLRRDGKRELLPLGIGGLVELGGWFGVPAIAGGDPLQATHRARVYAEALVPVDEFARRVATELPWSAWALIAIGIVATVSLRDRLLTAFTAAGLGWLALVTVMTESGYSGISRYAVPALVLLAVTAGAGVGWLVGMAGRREAVALGVSAAVLAAVFAVREPLLASRVDKVEQIGRLGKDSVEVMNKVGGAHSLIARCGSLGTNWVYTPVISWRAHISIGNVGHRNTAPAILLLTPNTTTATRQGLRNRLQVVPPPGTRRAETLANSSDWRIVKYSGSRPCGAPRPS
jgi:hypothetical protein